jgi:glutathione synthase/RimK-type ligase-like ATP-grasp enzyme
LKPIAIHKNQGGYTNRWIDYCIQHELPFKEINCYDSDIIKQLEGCSALLWHWNYENPTDRILALSLIKSLEHKDLKVFPNYSTCWHFNDKISQKYLLESIEAPLAETTLFFNREKAISWARLADYPVIFKLKGGAGSQNVFLLKSFKEAKRKIEKAFKKGFRYKNQKSILKDKFTSFQRDKSLINLYLLIKNLMILFFPTGRERIIEKEYGYAYFQEFIPGNQFDIRLVVIGDRCFSIKRMNRNRDFRASGSGKLDFNTAEIKKDLIKLSFDLTNRLNAQIVAYDFLYDSNENPKLLEISYGISIKSYDECVGYWDSKLDFHPGKNKLTDFMIEDLVASL